MAETPSFSKRFASSLTSWSVISAQPLMATLPSFASNPTMMCPGKALQARATNPGSFTAWVPMMQ